MNPHFQKYQQLITNSLKFRFFLFQRLPAALFSGLKIQSFNEKQAVITVKYKWFTQNPFRSMYFAVQSMAAEMSTGLLALGQVYQRKESVSTLVVALEAKFHKRGLDTIAFTCNDGEAIEKIIEETISSGEPRSMQCYSVGTNLAGEMVSEFWVTWSFKCKKA